ncbi:fimbria/pilus outer membrane usher protein [Enterovibrio sp. ZSDZ42]|uniref:Fimbria/pilus outer membrane usher protein n=1 Tax=Enterovibrio gelatinilyticus TaxID=2899819 RepID=A0ABT5R2P9_9GAMM|nr:fimbria/pilus outer membrane usher protein [Enterovibrio sp. ZSDZ42]MDD1794551.1 fimbria/pilus outer membrane usher protein [Enterovibrio sp. ZSDZ42]
MSTLLHRLVPVFLFVSLWGAPVAVAQQKINPTGRDITLTSLLRVSDSVIGETDITITADDDILLDKQSTIAVLKPLISEHDIDELARRNDGDTLSTLDFEYIGLGLTFEFSSLECVLTIPPDKMIAQQISIARRPVFTDYIQPRPFNGFLNVTLSNTQIQSYEGKSDNLSHYNHRFDGALNYKRLSLEYESSYSNIDGLTPNYLREGTRLNLDIPDMGSRLVLGDMFNNGTLFQDGIDVIGLGFTRNFSLIPTKNVRPKAAQTFTLTRTSSVDVVIDDVIVQRFTLNAGTYSLNDIPIAQGLNNISLLITDANGQQEEINFSVATGNQLLAAGEYEYTMMVGAPRTFEFDEFRYNTEQRVIMGDAQLGVFPWLTLGINGQQQEDLYQYGGSILFASGLGVTEVQASQSKHPILGAGNALRVAFDANISESNPWLSQFSLLYDQISPNFSAANDIDSHQSPLNSVGTFWSLFASFPEASGYKASLSASYSEGNTASNNYWSASPSLSGPLFSTKATWSARVDYQHFDSSDNEVSGTLTLSWPLGNTTRLVSRVQTENRQAGLDLTYQNGVGNTGGISAFASIETSENQDANLNAAIDYAANRYQISADHATRVSNFDDNMRSHNTRFEVSSALAFSGSEFAVGRKVGEAFAVISKHANLNDNDIAVDPSIDDQFARVFIDTPYNVLVSDLAAYSDQLISYDVENLPPGYDLGEGGFALYPGYRQGYALEIGSDAVITAIGTLLTVSRSEPLALVVGVANFLDDEETAPLEFFTNRQGRFAISGLRPGDYHVVLKTNPEQTLSITIPNGSDTFVRLGELYVD